MKLIKKWCLQLDNAMKFKTDEINKIKDYFTTEIREEETTSKTYSIYILQRLIILTKCYCLWQQQAMMLYLLQLFVHRQE